MPQGSISIGAEVIVSINGVPLKIYPALQFVLTGAVSGSTNHGGCVRGMLFFKKSLAASVASPAA